jgi:hypothetical protein
MTAVEFLVNQLEQNKFITKSQIHIAKEMEKHQLECAWYSSNENMRFQFSSSAYKAITFKQWLENFKNK